MVRSHRPWCLLYAIVKEHGGRGRGVSVMCAILGCTAQVHLFAAVLCGSPAIVFPLRYLPLVGCLGLISLMSVLRASACNTDTTPNQPHRNSNTHRTKNNTTNVVIQQNSRKLLITLQHSYRSNPPTPKLQHTSNQEQYDQCGNSAE